MAPTQPSQPSQPSSLQQPPHDVLITVVNHDNLDVLCACLDTMPRACDTHSWTCVVVDNVAGTDAPRVLAERYPHVTVIHNDTPKGFGANHNLAARAALEPEHAHEPEHTTPRYLLALNDDTLLEPNSIDILIDKMDSHHGLGAVGPSVVDRAGNPVRSTYPFPSPLRVVLQAIRGHGPTGPTGRRRRRPDNGEWLDGVCILFRPAAFLEAGMWDERFFLFYEDIDLGRRLANAGWRVALVPEARIVHLAHNTVARLGLQRDLHHQRSRYLYFRKHHGNTVATATIYGVRIGLLIRAIKAAIETLLHRNTREFALKLFHLARFDPRREMNVPVRD